MTATGSTSDKVILVTGAAGFIGFHLSRELLRRGIAVVGIDNLNDYYDVDLKHSRLEILFQYELFTFLNGGIGEVELLERAFTQHKPTVVVNLAAQAGVRFSIENPEVYVESNIVGFFRVLEACRRHPVDHLLYASSSSVYGGNTKVPFEESDRVDNPVSFYAATKLANEAMASSYSHLYGVPATALRFFTVYGPYGRPDMAYFDFVNSFFADRPVRVFNDGDERNDLSRDFTYIDDVVESIALLIDLPPNSNPRHRIINIGNNQPHTLTHFVSLLEGSVSTALGRPIVFRKVFESIKPGDVRATFASTDTLTQLTGFKPSTSLKEGLQRFADWYVEYYRVS